MPAQSLPWRRADLIGRVRKDLWRYLTPASSVETELLEASTLLQLSPSDVRSIGGLQFLMSGEVDRLLQRLPLLLRRLATTTAHEEERSTERIRGSIQWSATIAARASGAGSNLYVTSPSRRAFQTSENELLVFVLDEIVRLGRVSGWYRSSSETAGKTVSARVAQAEQWQQSRMLSQVERRGVSPRLVLRVRTGRFKRRYEDVLEAYDRYRSLVGSLDRATIRNAVERHGLVTRDDPTLFEIVCTFDVLKALESLGWELGPFGLFEGSLELSGTRGDEVIYVNYQHTPPRLSAGSAYRATQRLHGIKPGGLRPDLVIRRVTGDHERWLVIEVKGGERSVNKSARAAAYDLLAYRTAFATALSGNATPYGLGIAWGEQLGPRPEDGIMLCTPDTLPSALELVLG